MTEQYVEELIRKYADATATDKEVQQLMEWYRLSHIDQVSWPSGDPGVKAKLHHRMLERLQNEIIPKRGRIIRFSWLRAAAVVLVFLGAAFIIRYYFQPIPNSYTTVINPSGKVQLVRLPDSSKVWLNASTTLRYLTRFKADREVILDGEAYFEVTHDANHPFKVDAGGIKTTVLGTSFDIKAYKSGTQTSVSVISGKVRVENNSKQLAVLLPSDQLQFHRKNQIAKTAPIDINVVLAWKNGMLQFQGETFAEIAAVLEGWYGIKVVFENAAISDCRYYMSVGNTTTIENLLSMLANITNIEYVFNRDRSIVTITGNGCH
ncbi:MAG: FecR domain-containing protein [Chitinophagaceae bacterium]|nr:FecR domain-containing protein [Chitinophagaceae bacterium]